MAMTDATSTTQTQQAAVLPGAGSRDASTIAPIVLDDFRYVVRWRDDSDDGGPA